MKVRELILFFLPLLMCATACREDELVVPSEYEVVQDFAPRESDIRGFYLVNEGNMGSNKCTIDYYDYQTGLYNRNLYAERNPNVVMELGDVGNDVAVYGSKLYVVVNCSHKVEVMDAHSGVRIGQIDIPNCRYIKFRRNKAYITSYIGPVLIDPEAPKGAVFEVDTASLKVTRKVTVGYQPEEMEIVGDYMYVANSGGYRAPYYDNKLSVIELTDFKQVRQIPLGINLHRVRKDAYNQLWVTSQGDHESRASRIFVLDSHNPYNEMRPCDTLNIPCSNMAIHGDSLYFYSAQWNNFTQENTVSYGIINVKTHQLVSTNFITDGTDKEITIPYGIAIHPETGDIFVTDAKNYVSSGTLYCFNSQGRLKWKVRTGDIPAHIAFLKL